jgi:glycerol-3-phosphate dehydrogenase
MIRAGLVLYDRLGGRMTLPRSFSVDLSRSRWGAGLQPRFRKGFVYADARVDDARLVVVNARSAQAKGARIRVRTRLASARREGDLWRAQVETRQGASAEVTARAIVNAGGPWVKDVLDSVSTVPTAADVRHVKGSHIVVPRVHPEPHAYILQNADNRIVFVIPFQERYSLIGTTDVAVDDYADPAISADEVDYLLALANGYLATPLSKADIAWTYSGVRPLYDDGSSDPSAVTRDYVLKLDAGSDGDAPPVLSIFGGKITTYRKLAESVLAELQRYFPAMGAPWTRNEALPGGDLPSAGLDAWTAELQKRFANISADVVRGVAHRHGALALQVLGDARVPADLGEDFGNGLTAREVMYFVVHEWALTADDVLWRRSKCGLGMPEDARARVVALVAQTAGSLA